MTDQKKKAIDPAPYEKIVSTGPGKATYIGDGVFPAPAGKLDVVIDAYRKHIFPVVSKAPGLIYYCLARDDKQNHFRSISVWTSWEAAQEGTSSADFEVAKKAFFDALGAAGVAPPRPSFTNLPLYASLL